MLRKLNSILRALFVVLSVVFVLFKLIEGIEFEREPEGDGFQTHEFDDIW